MARAELLAGVLGQAVLLGCLNEAVGLGAVGWIAGLGWAAAVAAAMSRGLGARWAQARGLDPGATATTGAPARGIGPANRVTLLRAIVVGGVIALIADGLPTLPHPLLVGALAAAALLLDTADGWVARRTHTSSALGARFDMEVDAVMILVLSVAAAASYGWWVLLIGLARYALLAAAAVTPWLRGPIPPRLWRKAVAAMQGIVLAAAVSGVVPDVVALWLLVIAAAALALSFGQQIHWLHAQTPPWNRARTLRSPQRAVATRTA